MFSEVLKIIPKIDSSGLSNMEKGLNSRFARVAKKFGGGLVAALTGGGIVAGVVGLIDKFLNPLKEVREALEKTLNKGSDLTTFAKQFNTSAGNLARLQAFGQAKGLDPEGVRMLLGKFQAAVAQEIKDPNSNPAVRQFVGVKDTAEGFFEFIQSLQKIRSQSPNAANLIEQQVFGEKQILKASEFLNADFKDLNKKVTGPSTHDLTAAAGIFDQVGDAVAEKMASQGMFDLVNKAKIFGSEANQARLVNSLMKQSTLDVAHENKNLGHFDTLADADVKKQKLINIFSDNIAELLPILIRVMPKLEAAAEFFTTPTNQLGKTRLMRGVVGSGGKDK